MFNVSATMGVSRGVQGGANAPPWNLKMMPSYVVPLQNTLNFSLAPSALGTIPLKFSLKRHKIAKFKLFALSARKIDHFSNAVCVV